MRRIALSIAFILFLGANKVAEAQAAKHEFLKIDNQSGELLTIDIRPSADPGAKPIEWEGPFKVKNGEVLTQELQKLPGHEPYDISIRRENGTALVFGKIPLCTWMIRCANTGKTAWLTDALGWRANKDPKTPWISNPTLNRKVEAAADGNNVTIPITPFGGIEAGPTRPIVK